MILSRRIRATDAPPIPAARAWAARYDGRAGPALDLTQAVPGYPPPPALLAKLAEAAGSAASAGYGPIAGDAALREALAADASAFYRAAIPASAVAITAGCNLAFAMAMQVLAAEGEAVLVPTPWYFNHHMALTMQGVRTIPVPTRPEDGFVPDPARIAALLAEHKPRAVVLVTPNNPTGAIYPEAVIEQVAAACRTHGALLVLDETYRDFLPEDRIPPHRLFMDADWGEGLLHLYSFSKAYCVPGHRVGAVIAGPAVMTELEKAFDTFQICPPRPPQAALAWAIPTLAEWRDGNRALMAARAAFFRQAVSQLPGWRLDAIGTYFAFLRLPESAPDAMRAAEILAAEQGLMTLPGPFFGPGQDRHLRLAFANAEEPVLAQVPARLGAFT
ncbi:aminotransferase [Roseomonas sp. AR75]|uniref:aminotransferase n=1 Tax=Roseomonas sp. AR75 TaxID=2562311 RepID=UPI0010C15564|nr:aminotransferase [Roseomonas sp. AR75]